jgi:hypothetical protein
MRWSRVDHDYALVELTFDPVSFDVVRRRKGEPPLRISDIESRTKEFGEASE